MFQFRAIDVAIGMASPFLLLTFLASALVEVLAMLKNWRAEMLHGAIENMLADSRLVSVDDIYDNPLVKALFRNDAAHSILDIVERVGWEPEVRGVKTQMGTPPSYMPPATFSAAVLETLIDKTNEPVVLSPEGVIQHIQQLLAERPKKECPWCAAHPEANALRSILETTLATQGASIQAVRFALEKWFTDTMDRTSGWYKRRIQCCLLVVGLIMALGGNLSTIEVARWLWNGDAARQAAVAAATELVKQRPETVAVTKDGSSIKFGNLGTAMVGLSQDVSNREYPIGWPAKGISQIGIPLWLLAYLCGALITAIAISMGSTFWFDALQSLLKIRGSGPKPSGR